MAHKVGALWMSSTHIVPVCQCCFIYFLLYFCLPKEWTAGWWWWAPLPCVCQWRCWEPCDPDHPSTQAHCNLTPVSLPPPLLCQPSVGPMIWHRHLCVSPGVAFISFSPASPPPASLSSFLSLCLLDSLSDAKGGELARKLRERKSELKHIHMLCRLKTHGLYSEYLRTLHIRQNCWHCVWPNRFCGNELLRSVLTRHDSTSFHQYAIHRLHGM